MASPTFQAVGTLADANSGDITPALPVGYQADDIFILSVSLHSDASKTVSTPSGWTEFVNVERSDAAATFIYQRQLLYWRRSTATESAPTVTIPTGGLWSVIGAIAGFRGAVTSGDPIEATATDSNDAFANWTAPAIAPATPDTIAVIIGCGSDNGTNSTTPAGYTERWDYGTALSADSDNFGLTQELASTATVGPFSGTTTDAPYLITTHFNIKSTGAAIIPNIVMAPRLA